MTRRILLITIAAAAIVLCSCNRSKQNTDRKVITVSIEPQRWLLERIVGDRIEVNTLMARGGNPESYEPTFADLSSLEASDLYIEVGQLPFEKAMLEKIQANHKNLKVAAVSDSIELITDDHGHDHGIDPHVWNSAVNARIIARNMLRAVKSIDPEGAEKYDANYERLAAQIDSVDSLCRQLLESSRGASFVVWHPALSYFARDYGLHQLSVGAEGKEHSVEDARRVVEHIKEHGAQVFLVQKDFDTSKADVLAKSGAQLRVETVNPLNYEWDKELVATARAIAGR